MASLRAACQARAGPSRLIQRSWQRGAPLCDRDRVTGAGRRQPVVPAAASSARRHVSEQGQRRPRPENTPGPFFVDATCIDCDTCRWMAPSTFSRVGSMSAVVQQPATDGERAAALQAALACPTYSIHCTDRRPGEARAAQAAFPLPVPGCTAVYHCGFHAESSFGATSYLITRPQGNILVDVPRFTPWLAQRLRQLGGARWIFLTHRDDVADHALWAQHLGAARIIHKLEARTRQGTDKCEVMLEGEGPWGLPGSSADDSDVELIFTPGHTAGCVSLLFRPDQALFTGDHLAWSHRLQRMTIFRDYNWHSVPLQLESVAKLRGVEFLHCLPGHGRRASFADLGDMRRQLDALLSAEGYSG